MRTYESAGARLAYTDTGEGAPVVFLHPTPLDHRYWDPLIAELPGIRAIAPDFRGHGASELGAGLPIGGFVRVPDAPVLTMQQLAKDILALLDELSISEAIFAGCSIGGYALFELWRQAPKRMRGLAFICSKPQADTEAALARRADTIARVRAEEAGGFLDAMANTLPGATARRERPAVVSEVRATMTLNSEAVVAVQAGLAARPDSIPTVTTINVPVLAVAGGEDGSVTVAEMEALKAAPGGCEFHVLPNAGHLAAYEYPRAVAQIVAPWVGRRGLGIRD